MPAAAGPDPLPLMGLRSLRISTTPPIHRPHRSCDSLSSAANSSTDSSDTDDRCDSSLGEKKKQIFLCVAHCTFATTGLSGGTHNTKRIILDFVDFSV